MPPIERIAVFDNDGTLWCERPIHFQVLFALDRLDRLAADKPEMREQKPFKAFLERDLKTIAKFGKREAFEFVFATHAGITTEEFAGLTRSASTSRNSNCSTIYAPAASSRLLFPEAGSSSCAFSPKKSTAFRRSR